VLKDHIGFIDAHRDLYEQADCNDLAIIPRRPDHAPAPMHIVRGARPGTAEAGYQFDVVFVGPGVQPRRPGSAALRRYRPSSFPGRDLGTAPTAALEAYARRGGGSSFSTARSVPTSRGARRGDAPDFWREYGDADRDRIASIIASLDTSRILSSDPTVSTVRYAWGDRQVVHLLDCGYDPRPTPSGRDRHSALGPWPAGEATCRLLALGGETEPSSRVEGGRLIVDVPTVDPYAVLVLEEAAG
jgi:hypothetical protein